MTVIETTNPSASRKLAAEFAGTAILVAAIVGSGIMGERLADGNAALALLCNAIATGAVLTVLIASLAPVSGAHFNPIVTLSSLLGRDIGATLAARYMLAQIAGGVAGTLIAHAMFDLPLVQAATHVRTGLGQWLAEAVATFGLVGTILAMTRWQPGQIPWLVGLYITGAYWFTASTSFANPAVTIARAFTDTFSGIRPVDAPAFIAAQILGAVAATTAWSWLAEGFVKPKFVSNVFRQE